MTPDHLNQKMLRTFNDKSDIRAIAESLIKEERSPMYGIRVIGRGPYKSGNDFRHGEDSKVR